MKFCTNKYMLIAVLAIGIMLGCESKKETQNEQLTELTITCDSKAFEAAYENFQENTYIPCTVVYKGKTYKGVKMRVRGDTSREKPKKSLKLKFDKKQLFLDSLESINLNAEYSDKSLIRQKLSSEIFALQNLPCFQSNFVAVNMNSQFFGIYLQVENIDEHFLKRNKLDKKSNLYKGTKDGACLSEFDDVRVKWEKKAGKDTSFFDLEQLIKQIQITPTETFDIFLKTHFEYNKLIKMLATNMFIANGSTYYHNYYMYHNTNGNGKWQMFPWDLDKSISYYSWKPYLFHETSSDWESDNALVEKAFLNKTVRTDIAKAVEELQGLMNSDWVGNKIDKYKKMLAPWVLLDTTNQIVDQDKWNNQLGVESKFLLNRAEELKKQFELHPATFEVFKTPKQCVSDVLFTWQKSDRAEKYILYVSPDFLFKKDGTQKIEVSDTTYLAKGLTLGKYYWKVVAVNQHGKTTGFNSKNIFEVVKFNELTGTITNDLNVSNTDLYLVSGKVTIPKGYTIKLNPGATLYFEQDGQLMVKGRIEANGNKHEPIIFTNASNANYWHSVYADGASSVVLNYVEFNEGLLNIKRTTAQISNSNFVVNRRKMVFGDVRPSIIWSSKADIEISNISITGNGKGEGMNFNHGKVSVSKSSFTNVPDAIEFINVADGSIKQNTVVNCLDDAIDMNGCRNVEVSYNTLMNSADKGVSIGTEQYGKSTDIKVHHNIIVGNGIGVSVKDSSDAEIAQNTFFKNKVSVQAYQKRAGYLKGGTALLSNNIIEKSGAKAVIVDDKSDITFDNNTGSNLSGENHKKQDPKFQSASCLDFRSPLKQGALSHYDKLIAVTEVTIGEKGKGSDDYIVLESFTSLPISLTGWKLQVNGEKQKIHPIDLKPFEQVFLAKKPSEFYNDKGFYPTVFIADGIKEVKQIRLIDKDGVVHDEWVLEKEAKKPGNYKRL